MKEPPMPSTNDTRVVSYQPLVAPHDILAELPMGPERTALVEEARAEVKQVLDGEDRLGFYVARYDAEISYVDSEIGKLLDELSARGRMTNTLTAFTSDHGESLGEHGYYFNHGRFGFQTCLRVPLILHWPGKIAAAVDRQPVELVNLAPTLLAAAGFELPEGRWAQGRSLWRRITHRAVDDRERVAFSEAGIATRRNWLKMAREKVPFQGFPARICWLGYGERVKAGLKFNELVASGKVKAPIVIGRDHLDSGSVASPNRETESMKDGSDAISDWAILNAMINAVGGSTWVSFHHGGGVGMGYSQHAGVVVVCDGTREAARRIGRVLWNDPGTGVMRHADAGYDAAKRCARENGLDLPMLDG